MGVTRGIFQDPRRAIWPQSLHMCVPNSNNRTWLHAVLHLFRGAEVDPAPHDAMAPPHLQGGHEATDTQLSIIPVSQTIGHLQGGGGGVEKLC